MSSIGVSLVSRLNLLSSSFKTFSEQSHLFKLCLVTPRLGVLQQHLPLPLRLPSAFLQALGMRLTSFPLIFWTQNLYTDFQKDITAFFCIPTHFPIIVNLHVYQLKCYSKESLFLCPYPQSVFMLYFLKTACTFFLI